MAGNGNGIADLTASSTGQAGASLTYRLAPDGQPLPIKGLSVGVDTVRSLLGGRVNPDLPLFTVRQNGVTVILTLRDLKLAP
ncbi:MAG: hypothetical protein WC718_07335 [Phycisphaerales bacterium]|jgi:hypothetical protein